MIVSTVVENGRTVRTWQESRGDKTLTRKFYLRYRVNAICNGKHQTVALCETKDEAKKVLLDTKKEVDEKYQPREWLNESSRTPLTHLSDVGFLSTFGGEKSVSLYLTEEGTNETISEVIN